MTQDSVGRRGPVRATVDLLATTRTAVLLLALIAAAAVVGTLLPDPTARKYVYGRLWFCILLGLLGLNLVVCMVWRKRIGLARIWSLLTHSGILLVLVGAMVTLIVAERGSVKIYEGHESAVFVPEGGTLSGSATYAAATRTLRDPSARFVTRGVSAGDSVFYVRGGWSVASVADEHNLVRARGPSADVPSATEYRLEQPEPLGFTVRLLDFRITRYLPVDRLLLMRRNAKSVVLRVVPGRELDVPGAECRLSGVRFMPEEGEGVVEVAMPDGTKRQVAATVGTTQEINGDGLSLRILRYEPSFKKDIETGEVSSDSTEPNNPALHVALVRGEEEGEPHWLFARAPDFGHMGRGAGDSGLAGMRYLHASFPLVVAEAETASGVLPVRLENGKGVPSPWDPTLVLVYERRAGPMKEFESEVEVLQDGRVVAHHVIQVNDPLVYEGTNLSQSGYDKENRRYTVLGVSRDSGVWFVYAGFIAMMLGLMGRFYVGPLVRQLRARRPAKGGDDGSS